ncbi:hypothetical protein COTS27_01389 [Spirochaetota bacterium]|nr:hypothetical protein COTS27_01389 [Spirochaetota bacterium]
MEQEFQAAAEPNFIEVKIGGEVYKLKLGPNQEAAYLEKLARFVDGKVIEFKKFFPHIPQQTILMLTLLNLADIILKPKPEATKREHLTQSSSEPQPHTNAASQVEMTASDKDSVLYKTLSEQTNVLKEKLERVLKNKT